MRILTCYKILRVYKLKYYNIVQINNNFGNLYLNFFNHVKGPSLDRLLFSFLCGYKCPDYLEMCSICQMKGKWMDYKVFMSNIQISEV